MKCLIPVLTVFLLSFSAAAQESFQWPQNKKGAIVLTYDDALASQLNIAIPMLNAYSIKGTFFLDGRLSMDDMDKWKRAGEKGHELANHTMYHPCSGGKAFKVHPRYTSENYDPVTILREIRMMNKLLYGIDGKKSRTFAYPCSEITAGNSDYTDTLSTSGLVTYARTGGGNNSVVTDFRNLNPMLVPSFAVVNKEDGDALIRFVEKVKEEGGMGVLMFHGVGGDYLKVSSEVHEKLLRYLSDNRNEIWTGTFEEVMNYISGQAGK